MLMSMVERVSAINGRIVGTISLLVTANSTLTATSAAANRMKRISTRAGLRKLKNAGNRPRSNTRATVPPSGSRRKYSLFNKLSMAVAWMKTPGISRSTGVDSRSRSPEAVAPINTILSLKVAREIVWSVNSSGLVILSGSRLNESRISFASTL